MHDVYYILFIKLCKTYNVHIALSLIRYTLRNKRQPCMMHKLSAEPAQRQRIVPFRLLTAMIVIQRISHHVNILLYVSGIRSMLIAYCFSAAESAP